MCTRVHVCAQAEGPADEGAKLEQVRPVTPPLPETREDGGQPGRAGAGKWV